MSKSECVSMFVYKWIYVMVCVCVYRAHSDFSSVSRPQGSLGNTSSSSCPLPPNKQTESFLQVFMEPLTHAPPHSIWKSSDLANFERPLEEEGMVVVGGQRDALHANDSFEKNTFSSLMPRTAQ